MTMLAAVIVDHGNTTAVENWILIGSGAATLAIAWLLWHAIADCWDAWLADHERRDIIAAGTTAAIETWLAWLPTSAGMRVREAELAAGLYCVRATPLSAKRARLAEFKRDHPERGAA